MLLVTGKGNKVPSFFHVQITVNIFKSLMYLFEKLFRYSMPYLDNVALKQIEIFVLVGRITSLHLALN